VPHGAHDDRKIASALQHPGTEIMATAVQHQFLGSPASQRAWRNFLSTVVRCPEAEKALKIQPSRRSPQRAFNSSRARSLSAPLRSWVCGHQPQFPRFNRKPCHREHRHERAGRTSQSSLCLCVDFAGVRGHPHLYERRHDVRRTPQHPCDEELRRGLSAARAFTTPNAKGVHHRTAK